MKSGELLSTNDQQPKHGKTKRVLKIVYLFLVWALAKDAFLYDDPKSRNRIAVTTAVSLRPAKPSAGVGTISSCFGDSSSVSTWQYHHSSAALASVSRIVPSFDPIIFRRETYFCIFCYILIGQKHWTSQHKLHTIQCVQVGKPPSVEQTKGLSDNF